MGDLVHSAKPKWTDEKELDDDIKAITALRELYGELPADIDSIPMKFFNISWEYLSRFIVGCNSDRVRK